MKPISCLAVWLKSSSDMIMITSKSHILFLQLLLLFLILLIPSSFEQVIKCQEKERLALLKFKSHLNNYGAVSDWGEDDHCCNWSGVFCDNQTNHVVALYLGSSRVPVITGEGNINVSVLELPYLNYLDLSRNEFNETQIPEFICSLRKLRYLNLGYSGFVGQIPHCLGNLSELQYLDLGFNWVYDTNLDWVSGLKSLEYLDLTRSDLRGTIIPESLGNLTSLQVLKLSQNNLSGPVPESIRYLSKMDTINLGWNHLEGLISEAHLFNLSKLRELDLSFNLNLTVITTPSSWNPPFQLDTLNLASCKLGPYFPKWLRNQKRIQTLHISDAKIADKVPTWFWDNIKVCSTLNMSYNQMYGIIPNLSSKLSLVSIDLSSNEFNGSLPLFPQYLNSIDLSVNKFSGPISNICIEFINLEFLDLSDNLFSTQISQRCFMKLLTITYLGLSNNNFSGEIPDSEFDNISCRVSELRLWNNSFTGDISRSALKNCSNLVFLNLGINNFTGEIPDWLGDYMPELAVLSLQSNNIHGTMPWSLCHLQQLNVLDISINNISGTIPECLHNFTLLSSVIDPKLIDPHYWGSPHEGSYVMWKGKEANFYPNTLRFLTLIDLSSNNLSGEIPPQVTSLVGLVALNLSRNNLVGSIPRDISRLVLVNFLDLSRNKLEGGIPGTLAQLSHLGVLDLSFNNLSGKIPWGGQLQTFNASIYMGNPGLCGPPLLLKPCPDDQDMNKPTHDDVVDEEQEDNIFKSRGFYVSAALGFIIAFWVVSGTLFLNEWCRISIHKMLVTVGDWFYVTIMINKNRL